MADIGLIGLGVMGANLALNMAEKGCTVAVFNRTVEKVDAFVAGAGALAGMLVPTHDLAALATAVDGPRPILMMVQAGAPVDEQAEKLMPFLDQGDMLIDGGNANFRDTRRRAESFAARGIDFVGIGVSGGEEGARHGPSIMAGGSEAAWRRIGPILTAIAARFEGEPCAARVGPDGAGHFVKTMHNGIEYADMQMIAEVYGILRDGLGLAPAEMAAVFERWDGGHLKSYLIEITADVLAAVDPDTARPMVEVILDRAGQKGTGRWAAIEAQEMAVPATVIEAAVAARVASSQKESRLAAEARFGRAATRLAPADRDAFVDRLEAALLAGKIAAYAQGFAVMEAASERWGWRTPLGTVAKIWRAGCIIRSVFLDDIAHAYESADAAANLMTVPPFDAHLERTHAALRAIVAEAVLAGIPVPALSAALAYFDMARTARSTADLIQGQRDFFGAHGFERTDRPGSGFHGPWSGTQS
jgi:6-phosphogluconate dehydrogenase